MPPQKQSIYEIYFQITQESIQTYGPQTVLFYQVGAFFEMYGVQDPLTKRIKKSEMESFCQMTQLNISDKGIDHPEGAVVMAGFRDYSLDKYLKMTTQAGYTAVVYIQNATNPKAITREPYGVYSPGTFISFDTDSSPQLSNNIVCIWLSSYTTLQKTRQFLCGISSAHIFTGESTLYEYETPFLLNPTMFDELERSISLLSPSETVVLSFLSDKETKQVLSILSVPHTHVITMETERNTTKRTVLEKCQKQTYIQHQLSTTFGSESYQICQEFSQYPTATQSLCYLLHFLQERNPDLVKKMTLPRFLNSTHRVRLANHTLQQLNMVDDASMDGKQAGKFSSVVSFTNRCCTPMGKRAFVRQLTNPTSDPVWLEAQYAAIESFMTTPEETFAALRRELTTIKDLEKICRQTVVQKIYANTIYQLFESMTTIDKWMALLPFKGSLQGTLKGALQGALKGGLKGGLQGTLKGALTGPPTEFLAFLTSVLYIDRCKGVESTFQENIFRSGFSENLDKISQEYIDLQTLLDTIHKSLNKIMRKSGDDTEYVKIHETEKSGLSLQLTKKRAETLRNLLPATLIFGSSLEVPAKDIRFIKASSTTEEIEFPALTTLLRNLQTMKEKWSQAIQLAFTDLLKTLEKNWYDPLQEWIEWTIQIDLLQSKTHLAKKYNYCRPVIADNPSKSFFDAKGIRHPLIEHLQTNETYVTNDLDLSTPHSTQDGILLFGTNAVGKTSLIRAIGICIILAQAGLYVPCSSFVFSPYTAIFSRILGNDNLFKGLSTFAVEMSELRVILQSADEQSLVLGDELCSGTESESALSLFTAGLVELAQKGATYLFATHFHEITKYEEIQEIERLGLKHMSVRYDPTQQILLYDRLLKDGQGSRTYGLEVCKSLYMDAGFLERAYQIRSKYFPDQKGELAHDTTVYNAKKVRGICEICKDQMAEETHHLSPQKWADARGFMDPIQGSFHKNHPGNLASVCGSCHDRIHSENQTFVKKKTNRGYAVMEV